MTDTAGWVYDPEKKHLCMAPKGPDLVDHFEQAIWKCGECGLFWEVYWNTENRLKDMRPISPVDAEKRMNAVIA